MYKPSRMLEAFCSPCRCTSIGCHCPFPLLFLLGVGQDDTRIFSHTHYLGMGGQTNCLSVTNSSRSIEHTEELLLLHDSVTDVGKGIVLRPG